MKIAERHALLSNTIGTLRMEDEAYESAFYLSWIFYPTFFLVLLGQILSAWMYNNKFHPFVEILKGAKKQGTLILLTYFFN